MSVNVQVFMVSFGVLFADNDVPACLVCFRSGLVDIMTVMQYQVDLKLFGDPSRALKWTKLRPKRALISFKQHWSTW